MSKKQEQKRGFSIYSFLGKIGDILFFPIILISLFSSASMLIQHQQNKPTSFCGFSLVNVLSGSMVDHGFLKGDTVITKSARVSDIELGDVIAFYNYRDAKDNGTTKHIVVEYNYTNGEKEVDFSEENITVGISIDSIEFVERNGTKTVEDAQKSKSSVYFHQVIGIYLDDFGNVFYKTKGSNNTSADDYIRSDFVVGEYVSTPRFLRDSMSFCSSTLGMIVLVCLPLSALVLMQCFSLIKQVEIMNTEKHLILGKKRFNDEDVKKTFNGNEMETYNKVFLYYLTDPIEREALNNFMWSDVLEKENRSKREQELYNTITTANQKLETSNKEYWDEWLNNTKGHTRKKIKKYFEEIAVYNVLNENKTSSQEKVGNVVAFPTESKPQSVQPQTSVNTAKQTTLNTTASQNDTKAKSAVKKPATLASKQVKKPAIETTIAGEQKTKSVASKTEVAVAEPKAVTKKVPAKRTNLVKPTPQTKPQQVSKASNSTASASKQSTAKTVMVAPKKAVTTTAKASDLSEQPKPKIPKRSLTKK